MMYKFLVHKSEKKYDAKNVFEKIKFLEYSYSPLYTDLREWY